jgi:hypothetical protein
VVPIVWDVLNVHGTTVDVRLIYGPQLALGYEHVSDGGWVQRLTIGYGWSLWGKGEGPFPSDLVFALGFGRRLW